MKIEVLYIRGCPGYGPTLEAIKQIVAEERITATVTPIEVREGGAVGFFGSPTVRIDGKDIEPDAPTTACGLSCRTYVSDGRRRNAPSREMLRAAIQKPAPQKNP